MKTLDRKLLRDLRELWAQGLAIALVLAAGVATVVLGNGAYRSLDETRATYYERYRFADLFATAKRFPRSVVDQIAKIDGVTVAEGRIEQSAVLDIDGFNQPATGRILSLPPDRGLRLNELVMKSGRLPNGQKDSEVIISDTFAKAHQFKPGSQFRAILNGRKKRLTVVGIALSPEFIYALGPGDLIPNDQRYGIIWMGERAAEAAFDLDGAYNAIVAKLDKSSVPDAVIADIDRLLDRYGGTGAFVRKDQQSHAFIDAELNQLRTMSQIIPPIFFAVAAFLINMALSRLIVREREQIGLLKAVGYSSWSVALHYLKFVTVIAIIGVVIGIVAGNYLGRGMTRLYAEFFHFPFLYFHYSTLVYFLSIALSLAAAWFGALSAVRRAVSLSPAVAMAPPAPPNYGRNVFALPRLARLLPSTASMVLRHTLRFPVRSGLTILGIAASGGLLIMSMSSWNSIEFMIDVTYFRLQRQDITVTFRELKPKRIVNDLDKMVGVRRVEAVRFVPAKLRHRHWQKRVALEGLERHSDLRKTLGLNLEPVLVPDVGVALSEKLAQTLHVGLGDEIIVELTQGKRRKFSLPVTSILQGYIGLQAVMQLNVLNRLAGEGEVVSAADLLIDTQDLDQLYRELKDMPAVSAVMLQKSSLAMFRQTLARNITIMMTTFIVLAVIITFGVVYNSARIQLSERGRELASLRVLGFRRSEVSAILLGEIALFAVLALPFSWAFGYAFNWLLISGFDTDLYRVPFVIARQTYVYASLIMLLAAFVAALIVRLRVDRLDLIRVLKTRE